MQHICYTATHGCRWRLFDEMAHEDETYNIDINSACGWQPKDPYKKLRERARKELAMEPNPADTMLELRNAAQWVTPGSRQRPAAELFGTLWREGEVAVFFGEKGAGKSIFAVQLADSISRGRRLETGAWRHEDGAAISRVSRLSSRVSSAKPVLYLDFELSEQQFTGRYSLPPELPGKLPRRPRFKFTRAGIRWDGLVPPAFKGDVNRFLLHSIFHAIDESKASVVIIDSLSYLAANVSSNSSCLRIMKTLRQWSAALGISILVLAQAKPRRSSRNSAFRNPHSLSSPPYKGGVAASRGRGGSLSPLELSDLAGSRHIAEMADSVFAIGRSTFGAEFRYVKHLASRTADTRVRNSEVLTYSLSAASSISHHLTFSPSPCLNFLGPSNESDHLRDYEREAYDRERCSSPQADKGIRHQLSAREALVAGILDGSYARYLLGE